MVRHYSCVLTLPYIESVDQLMVIIVELFIDVANKNIPPPFYSDHPYGPDELQVYHYVCMSVCLLVYISVCMFVSIFVCMCAGTTCVYNVCASAHVLCVCVHV